MAVPPLALATVAVGCLSILLGVALLRYPREVRRLQVRYLRDDDLPAPTWGPDDEDEAFVRGATLFVFGLLCLVFGLVGW